MLDTQMIVGGKHAKYRFTIDDYCFDRASVFLFFGSETLVFAVGNPWEDVRPPLQSIWTS